MNGGDRREPMFRNDADRERFPATLGEACRKTNRPVHAYCLMANHFHLVLETPQASTGAAVAGISVEQLAGVFEVAGQTAGLVAGGRVGGRVSQGDPGKVAMAWRLREETTMTMAGIAERSTMGTKTHLAHLVYRQRRNK
jgi:hypothetical protein